MYGFLIIFEYCNTENIRNATLSPPTICLFVKRVVDRSTESISMRCTKIHFCTYRQKKLFQGHQYGRKVWPFRIFYLEKCMSVQNDICTVFPFLRLEENICVLEKADIHEQQRKLYWIMWKNAKINVSIEFRILDTLL